MDFHDHCTGSSVPNINITTKIIFIFIRLCNFINHAKNKKSQLKLKGQLI